MMLYISKAFKENMAATMHYNALKEIMGEKNVYTVDLRPGVAKNSLQYIAYGKYKNRFDRIVRWLQGNMMFISNGVITDICRIIKDNNIDVVFIEDSVFGNLVKQIKKKFPKVLVISFYHDIKAKLYADWICGKGLQDKIEYGIGIKQEHVNQKYADINIVFNQRDAQLYKSIYREEPEAVIAMGAPVPEIHVDVKEKIVAEKEKKKLLFVGKNYFPNIVGLKWFYQNVLPQLESNIQVDIVGRGLEYLKDELKDPRVNVIGGVERLDLYYEDSDIIFAPLFDGGGMKMKTIEAISYGKIFVGTEESLFGFWEEMDETIQNVRVFQCNTVEEWVMVLNKLADSQIAKFNEDVYRVFIDKFSHNVIKDKLKKIIYSLMRKE